MKLEQLNDDEILWRHPDDLNIYVRDHPEVTLEKKTQNLIYHLLSARECDIGDPGSYFIGDEVSVPIQDYNDTNNDHIP